MDALTFKKHIPEDWEKYNYLPSVASFKELKRAIESVEKNHIAIIMIPKNNHFLIEEDIIVKGYVSIFCQENVTFTNDRDRAGFTTGIELKNTTLNIFNARLITTSKESYHGFFSGSGSINTFDTDMDIHNGDMLSAGFMSDALSLTINGGDISKKGRGYLVEDGTGRDIPMMLHASFPNKIDESFIDCKNLTTNLFLPNRKEVN